MTPSLLFLGDVPWGAFHLCHVLDSPASLESESILWIQPSRATDPFKCQKVGNPTLTPSLLFLGDVPWGGFHLCHVLDSPASLESESIPWFQPSRATDTPKCQKVGNFPVTPSLLFVRDVPSCPFKYQHALDSQATLASVIGSWIHLVPSEMTLRCRKVGNLPDTMSLLFAGDVP